MSDPIDDLESFNSEGLPVNPLAPSEVRRLGDRMRRRRNATAVLAGVAAVAVIAAPLALYAGRDTAGPSPAPAPTTSTTSSPDVVVTTPPEPAPIHPLVEEIPSGFPLAASWPDDAEAEAEEMGLRGPSRKLDSLLFTMCGTTLDDADYVDRLRAEWTNVEDFRTRQLTTYADADEAVAAVKALTDFWRGCPVEEGSDGHVRLSQVIRTDQGGESWAMVKHYEFEGEPAIGLEVVHVIRLGRAVLINMEAGEGSLAPDPAVEARRVAATIAATTAVPVSRMCVFAEAGCSEGAGYIQPPRTGTVGPEGYGELRLGMTLAEALATGEAVVSRGPGTESCPGIRFLPEHSETADDAVISPGLGLAGIFITEAMRTPEGIGLGSTARELLAAYPDADMAYNGTYTIPIPGYPDRQYYAALETDDRVVEMSLELIDQACYR